MAVTPPDWPFLFLGSKESIEFVNSSRPISDQLPMGRLLLQEIPPEYMHEYTSREGHSRALTSPRFYKQVMPGVEWLFNFGVDSIVCANALQSLDDWLDLDWVAPPWYVSFACNGHSFKN